MTDEVLYDPTPELVAVDQVLIFDPVEFAEKTNSIAARLSEDGLVVLDKDNLLWRLVGVPAVRSVR